jgi:hypothetical protein
VEAVRLVESGWPLAAVEKLRAGPEPQFVSHFREGLESARGLPEYEIAHVPASLWRRNDQAFIGCGLEPGPNGHATESGPQRELPLARQPASARVSPADDPLEDPFLDALNRGLSCCHGSEYTSWRSPITSKTG